MLLQQSSRAPLQCRASRPQDALATWRMLRMPAGRRTSSCVVKASLEPINSDAIPMPPSIIPTRPVALPNYRVSMFGLLAGVLESRVITHQQPIVVFRRGISGDALKFNGPGPELINSRLAMMGLVGIAYLEGESGQTALQLMANPQIGWQVVAALFIYASVVPVLAGAKMEPFGPFTPKAEIVNGRAAMLGWAALLMLEYRAGVPFF